MLTLHNVKSVAEVKCAACNMGAKFDSPYDILNKALSSRGTGTKFLAYDKTLVE